MRQCASLLQIANRQVAVVAGQLLALLSYRVPLGRIRNPVRVYLCAVVTLILFPALIIGGWLASRSADAARVQLEQNLQQTTRAIAVEIDREITTVTSILTALASSHFLQTGDFEAFHRQASGVARELDIQIVLHDHDTDEQIFDTARAWRAPRLRGLPELADTDRRSLQSGQAAVSSVFYGRVLRRHLVAVRLPVQREGVPRYILGIAIPVTRFVAMLDGAQLRPDSFATIIARDNLIVARSRKHDEFVGKPSLSDFVSQASSLEGRNRGACYDSADCLWIYHRSQTAGWFVAIGTPESVLQEPSKLALASYAAAGSVLLVAAVILSYGLGGRLSQSVGALGIDRRPTEQEFQVLFESAPNGVVVIDSDGKIALLNAQMETMFGYWRDELVGRPVEILLPERFRAGHLELRRQFARAPKSRPMGAGRELFGRRQDGSEFPIEIGLNPISTAAGALTMATVVDITLRKRARERLSSALAERDDLRRRFMKAQEDERLRLARELHDQTGQNLTAAMLELKGIEPLVTDAGRERLRQLRTQLQHMGKTLHRVAWELRPASIDELGLASALGNHMAEWSAQSGIEADFHCSDRRLDELPDEIRTTVYRVVQEALTNIAKHATDTTTVSVIIDRADAVLRLTIEDNGHGFDLVSSTGLAGDRAGGLGLAGMRERLSLIGGELEIESSLGVGTTIFARIPLERERTAA